MYFNPLAFRESFPYSFLKEELMDFINATILGIVEGITEFLPISSTGHLIIVNQFVNFTDASFAKMFDIVIQLGAILAVVVYFWNRLWPFGAGKNRQERSTTFLTWKKVIVGVIPAVIIGAKFGHLIEEKLFNPNIVAGALIIGGIIIILVESRKKNARFADITSISYGTAVAIGFCQCLAMVPGTSRSAATIIGAMLLGASRIAAAEFSFFLAIPTMAAATVYSLWKHHASITVHQVELTAVGFLISFLVAWAVIAGFMNYIRKNDFRPFGYYRVALGAAIIVLLTKHVLTGGAM
jgi:undecaprenyl-diphosphatase